MCDEMSAIRPTVETDVKVNEMKVIDQFGKGLHDRIVRSDVKGLLNKAERCERT